jgi:glycosyltransferase involved in cell wall biosynthesis
MEVKVNYLVSVIIPIYNGEKYLRETIDSVLNQEYNNIQIILINDGSKDKSQATCDEYKKRYSNIVVIQQENRGVASARNLGIQIAEGKYLAFLDADDLWVKNLFDNQLLSLLNKNYDVIGLGYYRANENITRVRAVRVENKEILGGGVKLANSSWNHHSSYFIKREILIKYNIKIEYRRHEDEIFRIKFLYFARQIVYMNKMLFIYRNNPSSVTHTEKAIQALYSPIIDAYLSTKQWFSKNVEAKEIQEFCDNRIIELIIEFIENLPAEVKNYHDFVILVQNTKYNSYMENYYKFYLNKQKKHAMKLFKNNNKCFYYKYLIKTHITYMASKVNFLKNLRVLLIYNERYSR